jgi:hypothetical protein
MSEPEIAAGEVVGENLPATRPMPPVPASAGAGLTSTLAALPPDTARVVIAHSAEVAKELRSVIDSVRGPDGKPTLVAQFATTDRRSGVTKVHEHVTAEGWAMLGAMVGVGCKVVEQRTVDYSHPIHRPRAVGWESLAVAFDRASGEELAAEWGMCLRDERRWADAAEYAIRGMSATRARGRAFRAVLGYVMHLAGYDPTPAEEIVDAQVADGAPEPAASDDAKATKPQRDALITRCAKLDEQRPGEAPEPAGGVPEGEEWTWQDYLDRFLAARLGGRGIEGLTRKEAQRARERLDEYLGGAAAPPIEPPAPSAPAAPAAPVEAGTRPPVEPAPSPAPAAPSLVSGAAGAPEPPTAAPPAPPSGDAPTAADPGGALAAAPSGEGGAATAAAQPNVTGPTREGAGDTEGAAGSGAPAAPVPPADPWGQFENKTGGLEGKVREAQLRSRAAEGGLDEVDLLGVLGSFGIRAEALAHDLAADGDRYRRAVAGVEEAIAALGRAAATEGAVAGEGDRASTPSGGDVPASADSSPAEGPGQEAGAGTSAPDLPPAMNACTACGNPTPNEGACDDCRAYGIA